MSKKCPKCLGIFDDNQGFCCNCGCRLVDDIESDGLLTLGDANAISGGVNINRSKNITSHDTHYHSTIVHERSRSESELKLDAINQLRSKAEEIVAERGRIDSIAMAQLRPFALKLGIDEESFKSIIKDVRANRNGCTSGLSSANARYLEQAKQAIQTNDFDTLSDLFTRIEEMAAISDDDNLQYLYYLTLSLIDPDKSIEIYERQTDENYWRLFWAIVSYIRTSKNIAATKALVNFDPFRFEKPGDDQNLLEAYSHIMKDNKDGVQEFLDDILGEPSQQLAGFHRAVEIAFYGEEADNLEVQFYFEKFLSRLNPVIITAPNVKSPIVPESAVPQDEQPTGTSTQAEMLYSKACSASGSKRVLLLQKAAHAGLLDAMFDLSDCYYDGEGIDKNMELAIMWLTKAADSGHLKSQTALGYLYMTGADGFEQNYAHAEEYLTIAAERDFSKAQLALSYLYFRMQEYEKALVWARKVVDLENEAYSILGEIYTNGLGVEQNLSEGLKYYKKAAETGDADAQNMVGNYYFNGEGTEQDLDKAFGYYQMAAAQNHVYGMLNLGLCYAYGNGCQLNLEKAYELIEKAAENNCPEAQEWLIKRSDVDKAPIDSLSMTPDEAIDYAINTLSDGDPSKIDECVEILRRYANIGEPSAQYNLALCYHSGYGVNQNYQVAASWLNKSAKLGFAPSMYQLGEKYQEGHGCSINFVESAKWYRKAANLGMPEAQYRLGQLYISGDGVVANEEKALKLIKEAADQGLPEALEWLKNENLHNGAQLSQSKSSSSESKEPNIILNEVRVDTDHVGQLFIHCDWIASAMKGEKLLLKVSLHAKTGKAIKYDSCYNQYYNLSEMLFVKTINQHFIKTCPPIPLADFNMSHHEVKKVEFKIEFFRWGTNECIYSSKKMTFTLWYHFNLLSKNRFEVQTQKCLP